MNGRLVHAILAKGLECPDQLESWSKDPRFMAGAEIDLDEFDLSAIRKFAGLAFKVRHNGTRVFLPLTFRLLRLIENELDLFSDYAVYCSANKIRLATDALQRVDNLITYLGNWIDGGARAHLFLWDIVRHEGALAYLKNSSSLEEPQQHPLSAEIDGNCIPWIQGSLLLHKLQCDISTLISCLRKQQPSLDGVCSSVHNYAYWRPLKGERIDMLDLDDFSFELLRRTDGNRSIDQLSIALTGSKASAAFIEGVRQLSRLGLIGIDVSCDLTRGSLSH
jgi:hypothetical protein